MLDDFGKETFAALEEDIDFAATNMLADDLSLEEAAPWYEEFTDTMRAHALLWLLVEADPQSFFRDLTLSAQVRRQYLRRCEKEKLVNCFRACSRIEPFLDAVAGESFDLARDIAALSPADWLERDEYEDDYCFARFLYLWVASEGAERPAEPLSALLDRFEEALEGQDSARLDVCRALLAGDQQAFGEAFAALILERQEAVAALLPRTVGNPVLLLDAQVFVEGLAILRLADGLGFQTESEYPGCPRLARARRELGPVPDTLPAP
jgi:hypothetical protein